MLLGYMPGIKVEFIGNRKIRDSKVLGLPYEENCNKKGVYYGRNKWFEVH